MPIPRDAPPQRRELAIFIPVAILGAWAIFALYAPGRWWIVQWVMSWPAIAGFGLAFLFRREPPRAAGFEYTGAGPWLFAIFYPWLFEAAALALGYTVRAATGDGAFIHYQPEQVHTARAALRAAARRLPLRRPGPARLGRRGAGLARASGPAVARDAGPRGADQRRGLGHLSHPGSDRPAVLAPADGRLPRLDRRRRRALRRALPARGLGVALRRAALDLEPVEPAGGTQRSTPPREARAHFFSGALSYGIRMSTRKPWYAKYRRLS